MASAAAHDKDFARARLRAADDLRRDKTLSLATRMVGLEIFSCVNRATGNSFPSEVTIAHRLGITDRCVRMAVKDLAAADYLKITRRGRNNVYCPTLTRRKAEHSSGVNQEVSSGVAQSLAKPEPYDTNTGTQFQNTGTQVPPNSVLNSVNNPTAGSLARPPEGALRSPTEGRQKAENEIAKIVGWDCLTAAPQVEAEDLCKRWPHVDRAELLEFKRKYAK